VAMLEKRLEDLSSQLEASKDHPQDAPEWIRKEKRRVMAYDHIFAPDTGVQGSNVSEGPKSTTPESIRDEWPVCAPRLCA
jgi:hypothetical protein